MDPHNGRGDSGGNQRFGRGDDRARAPFGAAASHEIPALPVAGAVGLGLLIGAITVAGLILFWRYRK